MVDSSKITTHILQYKSKCYSESDISKVIKKIKKYKTLPVIDNNTKTQYFLDVAEGIVAGKSLYLVKNAGCFKYSDYSSDLISELARFILTLKVELALNDCDIQFLEGIPHFKKIHDLELKLTEKLKSELIQATKLCNFRGVQCSYIMTLCAFVEHLVVAHFKAPVDVDYSKPPKYQHKETLFDYDIEEIISALSFVISIYNEIPHMQDLPNFVLPQNVSTKRSRKILLLACRIRFLQELQQYNEQFGYKCCVTNGELYFLSTKANTHLLQDYRLGHIKRHVANMNCKTDTDRISIVEIIEQMRDLLKVERVDDPPRYRLHIPELIFEKICTVKELTREEYALIQFETDELNLNINFYDKPIFQNLTLLEYIQLRRLFLIFFYGQVFPLYDLYVANEVEDEVYFHSLIPCLNQTAFDCLRPHFGKKLESFLMINNYHETKSKIIDLMYQPIMPGGTNAQYSSVFYPLCSISSISNIGRNLFVLLKRFNNNEANEDGTIDPLINTLSTAFDATGICHIKDKKFVDITDIDFAFVIGSSVYIAECKRNTHPTDIFEARATIDAIHKAERQLDRIVNELSKPKRKKEFLQLFDVTFDTDPQIVPFVITGNRIFSNTNTFRYPVRHFRELIRFVDEGNMKIGNKEIYLRDSTGICEADMARFLSSNSPYRKCFVESMVKYRRIFTHGNTKIFIDDYALDLYGLDAYCNDMWGVSPLNPELFKK